MASICAIITGVTSPTQVAQFTLVPTDSEKEKEEKDDTQSALKIAGQVLRSGNFWAAVIGCFSVYFRSQIISSFLNIYIQILIPKSVLPPGSYQIGIFYAICSVSAPVS